MEGNGAIESIIGHGENIIKKLEKEVEVRQLYSISKKP